MNGHSASIDALPPCVTEHAAWRPGPVPSPLGGFDLTGRVALVTGARRGIGRAIATALSAQGAAVVVHHVEGAEEADDAREVLADIRALGGRGTTLAADFSHPGAGTQLAQGALAAFDRVDVLVLNASIEILEPFGSISPASFDRQMAVNLRAPLELLQVLLPGMARRGWGRVLAIGSTQQLRPSPSKLIYGATKAAQQNWVLNLARQLGSRGVTVNNLAPGVIATARNRAQVAVGGAELIRRIPAGRIGKPEDLVGAALLLCSDAGQYITGANLYVDGGRHIA